MAVSYFCHFELFLAGVLCCISSTCFPIACQQTAQMMVNGVPDKHSDPGLLRICLEFSRLVEYGWYLKVGKVHDRATWTCLLTDTTRDLEYWGKTFDDKYPF